MVVTICYSILALIFLLLASGIFKPGTWRELPESKVKLIRFGCFFFFVVIIINVLSRLLGG